ncbi:MAG: tetratricopeptide repeat protein [Cyanobacteria bacterium P01_H01_bin.15]
MAEVEQGHGADCVDDVAAYADISAFLPPGEPRFKVLVTTRVETLDINFSRLSLDVLTEATALNLLRALVGEARIDQELDTAKELVTALGGLPLGLELVGRYLVRRSGWSLAKILERLSIADKALTHPKSGMTAKKGVRDAFELSWAELDADAQRLALVLCLFATAPIQWEWVERCLPDINADELEDWRDESLLGLSLLQRVEEASYQLHPLVQEFLRDKLATSKDIETLKSALIKTVLKEAEQIEYPPTIQMVQAVTPIIPHVEEIIIEYLEVLTNEQLREPFRRLHEFYRGQLDYQTEEIWLKSAIEEIKRRLGENSIKYTAAINDLAVFYWEQGQNDRAEKLQQKVIDIERRVLSSDDANFAISLSVLALLFKGQGKYEEAEPLYSEAIAIDRKSLPPEHPNLSIRLNNLAGLYRAQAKYEEAEPLYLEAIAIDRKSLPPEHPNLAFRFNNLATLYREQGKYEEAEPLYSQAISIFEKSLPPEHPNTAIVKENYRKMQEMRNQSSEEKP